jgi:hypothetical protein
MILKSGSGLSEKILRQSRRRTAAVPYEAAALSSAVLAVHVAAIPVGEASTLRAGWRTRRPAMTREICGRRLSVVHGLETMDSETCRAQPRRRRASGDVGPCASRREGAAHDSQCRQDENGQSRFSPGDGRRGRRCRGQLIQIDSSLASRSRPVAVDLPGALWRHGRRPAISAGSPS